MAAIASRRVPALVVRPGLAGFEEFCQLVEFPLERYQRRIARAYFGPAREVAIVMPRGNAKTTLGALLALHHLVSVPGASVVIGASSRDQARIAFERAQSFLDATLELRRAVTQRHLELRFQGPEGRRLLRVIPSDGPRTHGLSCTLYVGDEVWTWSARADLLTAFQTGLVKRPDAKLLLISTSAGDLDSPLGRMRRRAMALPTAHRAGPIVEASSRDLHWLEWSLAEERDLDDLEAIARCNPAPWIGVPELRRQRQSVTETAFSVFHCCRWGLRETAWLPAGAWAACRGEVHFEPGERVWLGLDIGGHRSATAVVWINQKGHIGSAVMQGEEAIFDAVAVVMRLAERYEVVELSFDPWRAAAVVKGFEHRGIRCTVWPFTDSRVIPAAAQLYDAIIERKLVHDGDEELARHMAAVIARPTRRGVRIDKANESDQIDAASALLMSFESFTAPQPPAVELLGWL